MATANPKVVGVPPGRGGGRAGFTLVELLVVVAIIGILMSLVMPGLQHAVERGRNVACQNNLRQLAIVVRLHAMDRDDALPASQTTPASAGFVPRLTAWYAYVRKMGGSDQGMRCPSARADNRVLVPGGGISTVSGIGAWPAVGQNGWVPGYSANAFWMVRDDQWQPATAYHTLSEVPEPSKIAAFLDGDVSFFPWGDPKRAIRFRHGPDYRINVAMFDSHVESWMLDETLVPGDRYLADCPMRTVPLWKN